MNNNSNILKLVNLYHYCKLEEIPKYLLNDKYFMLYRIFIYDNYKSNYTDLNHRLNKFFYDKFFYYDLLNLYYYEVFCNTNRNNNYFNIIEKIIYFIVDCLNIVDDINNHDEISKYIKMKFPFILLFLNIENLDDEILINLYKNKYIKSYINDYYIDFNNVLYKNLENPNKLNVLFELIKNIDRVIKNYHFPKNKILLNLLTKKNKANIKMIDENEYNNYLFLQLIKTNKKYIYEIKEYYYTTKFKKYCILKYGLINLNKTNISKENIYSNKYINNTGIDNNALDKNLFFKKKDHYQDILYILICKNDFYIHITKFFSSLKTIIYKDKSLIKKILSNNKFYSMRLMIKYFYNDELQYNSNYINNFKNILNGYPSFEFYKKNYYLKSKFLNYLLSQCYYYNYDRIKYWYNNIYYFVFFDKKNFEKILYHYPNFFNSIYHHKSQVYKSKMINYENIKISTIYLPLTLKMNNEEITKFINNDNSKIFLKEINNKEDIINYCYKINCGILNHIPHFKDDYDIVSLSLKKDEEMIKYASVDYINKYIENNFDINKMLEEMKKIKIQ